LLVEMACSVCPPAHRVAYSTSAPQRLHRHHHRCERPQAQVTLVDASEAALEIARANAAQWAPANTTLLHSDWYSAVAAEHYPPDRGQSAVCGGRDAHLQQGDLRFEPHSDWLPVSMV